MEISNISPEMVSTATQDVPMKTKSGDDPDVARGKSISDLNSMFQKSEDADRELFAEMRSNILLVSGEHYSKKNNRFWNRLRDSRLLNVNQKLRLTKNHTQRITKIYRNNILKYCPGVRITPQLDTEIHDVKSAELNQAVWNHIKVQTDYRKSVTKWAQDFIDIGECAVKIYYDPNKGRLEGYEPHVDEFGQMEIDPQTGQPVPDKNKPVFSGQICHEKIHAFNILRDPASKTLSDSPYLVYRKMVGYHELLSQIKEPEARDKIEKSKDETFLVFNGSNGKYEQSKHQVLVREYYFRPSPEFPRGYFYIATKETIIHEGELPGGVFPIVVEGFDEIQTTPRKRSIIKQLRPYQAEINRAASQVATHQVTLGDDKLIIANAAKVEHGGVLPGVRVIKTNGVGANGGISILPGRSGEQFLGYIASQIDEMYLVANLDEEMKKKDNGMMDIWGTLYGSIKNKKEFSIYTDSFECFLVEVCKCSIELAKYHYPDTEIIQMIGKKELVNLEEFRSTTPMEYDIKIEPSSDDAESIMGRQSMINHTLQYVGDKLDRNDIGKILKESPIGNFNKAFDDLTVDYDNAKNDILQLERGQMPNLNRYEDTKYKIKALTHRMKQSDYEFLDPQVQQLCAQYLQVCEQAESQKVAEIQRAESGFIPDGGGLITINGIKDENGEVLRVPYSSIEWLVQKLIDQNVIKGSFEIMNNGAVADMSNMLGSQGDVIPNF